MATAKVKVRDTERDAIFLGLREPTDEDEIVYKGYALVDSTLWGPTATKDFIRQKLAQKVSNLLSETPKPQSDDITKPHYAPKIWIP